MAVWCPVTEEKVLYLECNECEDKIACKMGLLVQEEKEEVNLEKEPNEEKENGELF